MAQERAGNPVPEAWRVHIPRLVSLYYTQQPDIHIPEQRIIFGTSGHRGSSLNASFTEAHILGVAQAVCEYRREQGITGPLFLGMDTHALSEPAQRTVLEVLVANEVTCFFQQGFGYTPTPVISHAILTANKGRSSGLADGLIITPSHNPPQDGGIKYNPPHGGPAGTAVTKWIEDRANALLARPGSVRRVPLERALRSNFCREHDFIWPYVHELEYILDMQAIARSGLRLGVDPLGGAGLAYWGPIAEYYGLDLQVVNDVCDPAFMFMTLDRDEKIRMDCSSAFAMARLIAHKDVFDLAFANDPDADRHGIVTSGHGLMNPNHYLAVAADYLLQHRPQWDQNLPIGKTLVTSSMLDRVAATYGRSVYEVPVGFKWFADSLVHGRCCFCGEESAGASFLRQDGSVWSTDKDGILLNLLAAEILAVTGEDPGERYKGLEAKHGKCLYERVQASANFAQKKVLAALHSEQITSDSLAGEKIVSVLTKAPGNDQPIGGLKVATANGWFAARPSGTEDLYKIYAESFLGEEHLAKMQREAQMLVSTVLAD